MRSSQIRRGEGPVSYNQSGRALIEIARERADAAEIRAAIDEHAAANAAAGEED